MPSPFHFTLESICCRQCERRCDYVIGLAQDVLIYLDIIIKHSIASAVTCIYLPTASDRRAWTSSLSGALCSGCSCPMCRHFGMDRQGSRTAGRGPSHGLVSLSCPALMACSCLQLSAVRTSSRMRFGQFWLRDLLRNLAAGS